MSVQELKKELEELSVAERAEIAAYLFQLRHEANAEYQASLQRRMDDKNPVHWLTPEEFEKRLEQK